jgi:hypothetical protein
MFGYEFNCTRSTNEMTNDPLLGFQVVFKFCSIITPYMLFLCTILSTFCVLKDLVLFNAKFQQNVCYIKMNILKFLLNL